MGSAIDSIFGSTGEGGRNAGNVFDYDKEGALSSKELKNKLLGGMYDKRFDQDASQQVQSNPLLSGLFGKGGTLDRTIGQEQSLGSKGFSLQPEDHEAYGQASGDIARMFGQNDQSLAQALSDRGLSSSGVAGQQFSGSLGNKNEQLAKIQTDIAQKRMQMNNDRLNQTRNFLTQMGGQAQNALNSQRDTNFQGTDVAMKQGQMAEDYLKAQQGQANENLSQYQQTNQASGLGQVAGGLGQMALSGATGGMSGLGSAIGSGLSSIGSGVAGMFRKGPPKLGVDPSQAMFGSHDDRSANLYNQS